MTQCGKIQNLTKCTQFLFFFKPTFISTHTRLSHANLSYLHNMLFSNLHKVQTYENRKNVTQYQCSIFEVSYKYLSNYIVTLKCLSFIETIQFVSVLINCLNLLTTKWVFCWNVPIVPPFYNN